jgi:hypothetical protein
MSGPEMTQTTCETNKTFENHWPHADTLTHVIKTMIGPLSAPKSTNQGSTDKNELGDTTANMSDRIAKQATSIINAFLT